MRELAMFRGSYTVMVTPFDAAGAVDEGVLRRFVDFQIEGGTQGLIPLGSTGEFLSLTREERERVAAIVVEQARGRVPVLVGTAAEWTREAVELARDAERVGADGLMIVPPYYSSPTDDEVFAHYRAIAQAVSVPIMVYNNPFTANIDLKPRLVARLSEIDNIRYIKESSNHATRVQEILMLCGDRMSVFAGFHPWESFRCGATGCVSVCANIVPGLATDLFEFTVSDPGLEKGLAVYRKLIPLLNALAGDLYVGATKAALGLIGQDVGIPRPPRLGLPEAKMPELRRVLQDLDLKLVR